MSDVLDPAIVDLDRVAAWMSERGLEDGPISDVSLIAGGTQNVLVRFRRGSREFVLRRPPPHKRANSDETMRREARVLGALAGSDVPHPGLIAAEPSLDVIGAAFYLMEPVDGFNATLGLPEPHRSDRRSSTTWACRWPTPSARWPGSTSRPVGCPTSASPTAGASARCRGGASSSTATASCPATPARRSRGSTTSPRGSTPTGPTTSRWA